MQSCTTTEYYNEEDPIGTALVDPDRPVSAIDADKVPAQVNPNNRRAKNKADNAAGTGKDTVREAEGVWRLSPLPNA